MATRRITIGEGPDAIPGFLAEPFGSPAGGIVILHEIFGANPAMRAEADRWADEGYLVLLPDLYHRQAPATALGYSDAERDEAVKLWQEFDLATAVSDALHCADCLEAMLPKGRNRIAVIGFCLGGQLAVLAGDRFAAAVAFYPVKMAEHEDDLRRLTTPLQLHCGTDDFHIPEDVLSLIDRSLGAKSHSQLLTYDGAGHAFYNDYRPQGFIPEVAREARRATHAFLAKHLGSEVSP